MQGRGRRLFLCYAAALIVLFSVGASLFYLGQEDGPGHSLEMARQELLPAKGIVVLELSNGQNIPLTGTATIEEQGGRVIENDSSRVLDYTKVKENEVVPVYNKITVPTGRRVSGAFVRWFQSSIEFMFIIEIPGSFRGR